MSLLEKQETKYGSIINGLDNRFVERKKDLLMDIDNNTRSKEIVKYYSLKYNAYANLFFYACIILIIYLIIRYMEVIGLLPSFIATPILLLLSTLGIVYYLYLRQDINRRSNINFDKYDFKMNNKDRNTNPVVKFENGSLENQNNGSCTGADCCPYGTTFDMKLNKCQI